MVREETDVFLTKVRSLGIRERLIVSERVSGRGMSTTPEAAGPRDATLSRLSDKSCEIPDVALAAILDAYRHDRRVHRALIARPALPEAIVLRLIRLVARRSDLDNLLARHAPAAPVTADLRAARLRPGWWRERFAISVPLSLSKISSA